jgi:glyoxylase-like metal-dependent hydrolase (beta-lactamase superfamily II)
VRVVSLHPDVLVATSAIWQTNCVIVRAGGDPETQAGADSEGVGGSREAGGSGEVGGAGQTGETFVIDSPILPHELDALPALVQQAGFPVPSGLLATHGDWDHLLGRLAFGELALGCAESTAARMQASPGAAQRELRAFDEEHFIERARPLALGAVQALPVPGGCGIGDRELELHPAGGHTGDGIAIVIPWARVLVAGDYLSSVELPVLGADGTTEAYADTLRSLRPLVQRAEQVVPGHGRVLDSEQALAILEEDLTYVEGDELSSSTRLRSGRPPRSGRPRG